MTGHSGSAEEALDFPTPETPKADRRQGRLLYWGAAVLAAIALAAVAVPGLTISAKQDQLLEQVAQRLELTAAGQAGVVTTWLQGTRRLVDPLAESELLRLFAAEMDLAGGDLARMSAEPSQDDPGLGVPLVDQIPFVERIVSDFAGNSDFLAAYLIGRKGDSFVTSSGAGPFSVEQRRVAEAVFETQDTVYGPARPAPAGLVMDMAVPIYPALARPGSGMPVAVLVLVVPLAGGLSEVLAEDPLDSAGAGRALVQYADGVLTSIDPGKPDRLQPVEIAGFDPANRDLAFAERASLTGLGRVFSSGAAVTGPDWWVVEELEVAVAKRPLSTFVNAAIIVAFLVVVAVAVAFGAFWWRLSSHHNSILAEQYRSLAGRIQAQKQLLDAINGTVREFIVLKRSDGSYRYVNQAFAKAAARDPAAMVGLDDAAVFGQGTARRLAVSDQRVISSGAAVTVDDEVYLGDKPHYLQFSKVPFRGQGEEGDGILSVTRDITDLVENQRKKERAIQQMVTALVRAIELRDPYLAGHSRLLAEFSVAVGRQLGCSDEELGTLEMAANLSQIGKLALPKSLLNKPSRLTEAENAEVQKHIEHALRALSGIDFELPVIDALSQMYERLDGDGYPNRLKGDEIGLLGRILGACDVFCARIEPRSYRAGLAPDAVLDILRDNATRYDPKVIEALQQVVATVSGEKLIASIAAG
jgi:PAS domain-containing protein